jgi:hypothetical protein
MRMIRERCGEKCTKPNRNSPLRHTETVDNQDTTSPQATPPPKRVNTEPSAKPEGTARERGEP